LGGGCHHAFPPITEGNASDRLKVRSAVQAACQKIGENNFAFAIHDNVYWRTVGQQSIRLIGYLIAAEHDQRLGQNRLDTPCHLHVRASIPEEVRETEHILLRRRAFDKPLQSFPARLGAAFQLSA
jgi:hypothetical protein